MHRIPLNTQQQTIPVAKISYLILCCKSKWEQNNVAEWSILTREMKCPYTKQDSNMTGACNATEFFCGLVSRKSRLKRQYLCYHQVQLQLYCYSQTRMVWFICIHLQGLCMWENVFWPSLAKSVCALTGGTLSILAIGLTVMLLLQWLIMCLFQRYTWSVSIAHMIKIATEQQLGYYYQGQ